MYFQKKTEVLKERGAHDYGILKAWGGNAFWNFRTHGGVKTLKPSVVGYGYFLELPNLRQRRNGMRDKTCLPCVNSDLVQALLLLQGVLPANLLLKRKSGAPKKTNDFCHIVS